MVDNAPPDDKADDVLQRADALLHRHRRTAASPSPVVDPAGTGSDPAAEIPTLHRDQLRAVLGDKKLNYLGYSYGTLLGATYADLYPKNTGRLVLDGAVDPATSLFDVNVTQAKGFESAMRAFLVGGTVE